MSGYIVFNDVNSQTFNAEVFWKAIDVSPKRDYTTQTIPGRNGSLYIDNQRYLNPSMTYDMLFLSEADLQSAKDFFLSQIGYKRLEDSFHPDEFYKAVFSADINPKTTRFRDWFKFKATFERKPERYLKSGENASVFTSSGSIVNPTPYDAKPLLRAYGTGRIEIGSYAITINVCEDTYTDIDCESMECYKGANSCNKFVELQNDVFPVLHQGSNGISLTGITRLEVTPRWYVI